MDKAVPPMGVLLLGLAITFLEHPIGILILTISGLSAMAIVVYLRAAVRAEKERQDQACLDRKHHEFLLRSRTERKLR